MAIDGSFSVHSSLRRFLDRCPKLQSFPQYDSLAQKGYLVTEEEVVNMLGGVFLHPNYTIPLMGCFRPIARKFVDKAVALLRLVPNLRSNTKDTALEDDFDRVLAEVVNVIEYYSQQRRGLDLHELTCLAFCRALDMAPFLLSSVLSYFNFAPAPFERFSVKQVTVETHELRVARISFRLLLMEPEIFSKRWDWSCFLDLVKEPRKPDLIWCGVQILRVVLKLGYRATESLNIGAEEAFACLMRWEEFCQDTSLEKAGWYIEPTADNVSGSSDRSMNFNQENCLKSFGFNYQSVSSPKLHELQPPFRSQRLATRDDISVSNTFILTSAVKKSYERVLLAVSQKWPVLLYGPSGSGKSALIAKLAQDIGNQVLSIQMDDQIDGRTLVGGYVCTERPGEFRWQPGSLTQAVQNGFWIVFEDINKAPSDVHSILMPLLEGAGSFVTGHGEVIRVAESFRMFSTIAISKFDISQSADDADDVPKDGRPPTEEELHQFFLPFRGFCARKGIAAMELVLHDIDVPSALTDYVVENSISNVVVGASHWNAFIRRFRDADVPTSLAKSLPESCTLYVISKGKVQNIRPTGHPQDRSPQNINVTPTSRSIREIVDLLQNSSLVHPHKLLPDTPDSEDINRDSFKDGNGSGSSNGWPSILVTPRKFNEDTNSPRGPRLSAESSSSQNSSNRSSPANSDSSGRLGLHFTDTSHGNQEVVVNSDSSKCIASSKPPMSLETEIRKLKLELKKTTEHYSKACREAVLAQQKAMELEKYRQEKERNLEQARLAEEAALALAEVERQKAKAAMESAEMETQKRKQAEIRAMQEEEEKKRALTAIAYNNIPYRRYNIEEIEVATHYFDNALKIGEGGYGPVFKGVLDHTVVAIKVLRPDLAHGERQFQQEVDVLSTIRHPNMVLLLGACPEFGCLVYEYLENGSLEDRLFQKDNTPPIPWRTRFKIASEIATGLLFLHQTKPEPVVHRDLKPANILLDRNYVSKISDVGLARLVPPHVANKTTQYRMTGAAGTFCYIDPEYQQSGLLGVKSDIYSLGVVVVQIITGKPPMGLSHLVEKAIQTGKFPEVLDPSVADWPAKEALSCARLALKCCELRKRDRPDLGTVILPKLNRLRDLGVATDTNGLRSSTFLKELHGYAVIDATAHIH